MNYYKYILFCILIFSFIKYQYNFRNEVIAQIVVGSVIVVVAIDYINENDYNINLPFMASNKTKKTKQHKDESSIDNDSLELLNEDIESDSYVRQDKLPPYFSM